MAMTEQNLADLDDFLVEQTDADAIVYLLTIHKAAEIHADNIEASDLRGVLAADAVAIFHVLERFAPETLEDALAIWYEHAEEVPDDA
jgi:hypothetical protein